MEKNQNNEVIITRLVQSHAPNSVVIMDKEKCSCQYVDGFLSENGATLAEASILPLRFDCTLFSDKVAFWKGIAKSIKDAVPTDYEWSEDALDAWDDIRSSHDTYFLKEDIITIAQEYLDQTGWRFLLVFEEFENILEKMDKQDSLKVRSLSLTFVLMTVSHTPLKELGKKLYNDVYYCNQFVSFKIY